MVIDLRSDTVTRPTAGMRRALAEAEVGDDTLGDDPSVLRLQERVAGLLGKEAALFFPSGIMANQTAILVQAPPGTEVLIEASAHILDWEDAAAAHWGGVQLRPVVGREGLLDAELVRPALRPRSRFQAATALLCLENTHNAAGGRVLPLERFREIRQAALDAGVAVHLDGARLWNASAATGVPEREFAALADTVMVTLSKGLGCPVGSLLAGSAATIERAWRMRRRLGGSMRQAGVLAAAGLYALDHHRDRLAVDHAHARLFAELAAASPRLRVVPPESNIVMIELPATGPEAAAVVARLATAGILVSPFGAYRLRAVTHLDVDEAAIRRAAQALVELSG
jgi:threonine aldolase